MHKSIYIPFLLIVLFDMTHTARGQSIYLDNIDNNTSAVKKAGVSKEFIYVFEIKKDKLRDSGIAVVITYDTSGCVVSSERYDLPFDPKAKTIYYYNDRLKLIKMATLLLKILPKQRQKQEIQLLIVYFKILKIQEMQLLMLKVEPKNLCVFLVVKKTYNYLMVLTNNYLN